MHIKLLILQFCIDMLCSPSRNILLEGKDKYLRVVFCTKLILGFYLNFHEANFLNFIFMIIFPTMLRFHQNVPSYAKWLIMAWQHRQKGKPFLHNPVKLSLWAREIKMPSYWENRERRANALKAINIQAQI